MKQKIYGIFPIFVNLIILNIALIIGGASFAFADNERYIFELVVENNKSKVNSVMQIYAANEREARENINANGWRVISVKQLTYKQANSVPIQIGEEPVQYINIESSLGHSEKHSLTDDELIAAILNTKPIADDVYIVAKSDATATKKVDNTTDTTTSQLGLTPKSDKLEYLYTIYFKLGDVEPIVDNTTLANLSNLSDNKTYYLFGYTDNIKVHKNEMYKNNYELSFKRANAVKQMLVKGGMSPAKINTIGLGAQYPVQKNIYGADGTIQNRRVEIYGVR